MLDAWVTSGSHESETHYYEGIQCQAFDHRRGDDPQQAISKVRESSLSFIPGCPRLSMKLVLLLCAAAVAAGWSPMAGLKVQSRATAVRMGATTDWVRRLPARQMASVLC